LEKRPLGKGGLFVFVGKDMKKKTGDDLFCHPMAFIPLTRMIKGGFFATNPNQTNLPAKPFRRKTIMVGHYNK